MTRTLLFIATLAACVGDGADTDTDPDDQPVDADGDGVPAASDCDDTDPDVFPGADERCDGVDDDCDQEVDEDAVDAPTWWVDGDADGYGVEGDPVVGCTAPPGRADQVGDCDDAREDVHPAAPEICLDGADNDCDGVVTGCSLTGETTTASASVIWPAVLHGTCINARIHSDDDLPDLLCGGPALTFLDSPVLEGFPRPAVIGYASFTSGLFPWAFGDFNGDGLMDTLAASGDVFLSPATRNPPPSLTVKLPFGRGPMVMAGDFDGDGRDDAVFMFPEGGYWVVLAPDLVDGASVEAVAALSGEVGHAFSIPLVADIIGDPTPDLVFGGSTVTAVDGSLRGAQGATGVELDRAVPGVSLPVHGGTRALAAESGPDRTEQWIKLWEVPVDRALPEEPVIWIDGTRSAALSAGDLNDDGRPDLVVSTQLGLYVFHGPVTGRRHLDEADLTITQGLDGIGGFGESPLIDDFDGDGRADLFQPGAPDWGAFVYLGDGR